MFAEASFLFLPGTALLAGQKEDVTVKWKHGLVHLLLREPQGKVGPFSRTPFIS